MLRRMMRAGSGLLVLSLMICAALAVSARSSTAAAAEPIEVLGHSASIHESNSLIALIEVRLSSTARVQVEYGNSEAGRFRSALTDAAVEHEIPIVRLRASTTYDYRIGVETEGGGDIFFPSSGAGEFTTGPLPDVLAGLASRVSGRSTQPLILSDLEIITETGDSNFSYLLFRDSRGRIVWYHRLPLESARIGAVKRRANGNLIYEVGWQCCLREITPLGELVREIPAAELGALLHHDFALLDDDRILVLDDRDLVIDDTANGGDAETLVTADALVIWDAASGTSERVWEATDFWDAASPDQRITWARLAWAGDGYRWTHANSVQVGASGSVVLSLAARSQIISIAPDFQTIEWQLGGPESDYEFPNPADRFWSQHTASQLPNGNILLFDNGLGRPRVEGGHYSRALELRLDEHSRTAEKVWEYRPDPDVFSLYIGSAYRLGNGNTLVNFGFSVALARRPIVLVEADAAGNEVFRLELSGTGGGRQYRAYGGFDSIMGETRLPSAEDLRAGLSGTGADQFAAWRAGFSTTASELLAALAGEGVRSLWLREGSAWQRYAVGADGRSIPGSADFAVAPGAKLWLGG